jgi:glycosyltransferase involved in cell wall biosynthesis
VIGVFGYGGFGPEEVLTDVIVEALADLKRQGLNTRLLLLGHPGPASVAADRWRQATARVGIDTLEFTGVLEPEVLSQRLREVDVMILPDRSGPTGRKATLAASLAHGLPVVGFQAPTAWQHLANEGAVRLAPKTNKGLAQALMELLQNDDLRVGLGLRAGEFYQENVRPELMVRRLLGFLDTLSGRSEATQRPATSPHVAGPRSGA